MNYDVKIFIGIPTITYYLNIAKDKIPTMLTHTYMLMCVCIHYVNKLES